MGDWLRGCGWKYDIYFSKNSESIDRLANFLLLLLRVQWLKYLWSDTVQYNSQDGRNAMG